MSTENLAGDRAALERLLGTADMAWFRERVRGRILAADGQPLVGTVRLRAPTRDQRTAMWQLVGRPARSGASLNVNLTAVEQILRRGPWPAGLADAIETLTGPVIDHGTRRAHEQFCWEQARDRLKPAAQAFDGLHQWWVAWCSAGGLKRAARAEADRTGADSSLEVADALVERVAKVLEEIPTEGEPLAVLARRVTGDAHGLDATRPLGRLAVAAVRAAMGVPEDAPVREVWAAAGVMMSSVASTVLCLGVGGDPETGATGAVLETMREARMPLVLTLDQVRSGGVRPVPVCGAIYVCENPTVVEVVAERWARAGTAAELVLVCTWGQPSTAVTELLKNLAGGGATVYYHGDFDWAGLRIAQSLRQHVDWKPWRFTCADYLDALRGDWPSLALKGKPAASDWDLELAATMAVTGLAVEEEAVADLLAADLTC